MNDDGWIFNDDDDDDDCGGAGGDDEHDDWYLKVMKGDEWMHWYHMNAWIQQLKHMEELIQIKK